MGKAPPAVPPGAFEQLCPAPLALCNIREIHVFQISFSPGGPEGQSSGLFFLLDFDPVKHRWVVTMAMGTGGTGSSWLEFFLIPPCPLALRQ